MWFGTGNGLSKYDGNQFKNYLLEKNFPVAVSKMEEDNQHNLYLLTNDWLTKFDCRNEHAHILHISMDGKIYQVTDFLLLNDSTIFACNNTSLVQLKVEKQPNSILNMQEIYPFPLKEAERFMKICIAENKRLLYLITNQGRILLLDICTQSIVKEKQLSVPDKEFGVSSLLCRNGNLWITSMLHGIFILDESLEHTYNIVNASNLQPTKLSHNDVYNVIPISPDSYLATTWYGYTLLYPSVEISTKWNTEVYTNVPVWQAQNIELRMISSYYDPDGILWIGTHGGGIIVSDWRWNFIKRYEQNCDNETESILTDETGRIYLATYNRGVMRSEKAFKSFNTPLTFETLSIIPNSGPALCAVKDGHNQLWFGSKNGTLICYNPSKEKHTTYTLKHGTATIHSLFIDSKQHFWIGTEEGLFLFNPITLQEEEIPLKQTINCVLDIDEDKKGNLWIATSLGLLKAKRQEREWDIRKCDGGVAANTAQTVLADSENYIYVGYKNGLGIIPPGQSTIREFLTTNDGLSSNWINCLREDEQGYIWIGSNSGITRYDKRKKQFSNYYISNSNRTVASINQLLFWGGSKHLTYFDPRQAVSAFEANKTNKVFITRIEVNNKSVGIGEVINKQVILNQAIEYTDQITLSDENKNFSLSFSNLPYSDNMQTYNYRLTPYQTEWITCNNKERISYINLPAGTYTFQVKNIYPDKSDSKVTSLKIIIQPHWTQTWFFYLSVFTLSMGVIYYLVHLIKKRQQRQQRMLNLEHELTLANMMHQQEKKLREERENFFTGAAHELRTPLTLILAPLNELLQYMKPSETIYTKLSQIRKSANSLHTLVDRLLHIQKIDTGMVQLRLSQANILTIIYNTVSSFRNLAITQGITFEVMARYDRQLLWIDTEKIETALRNLLSNAFKYTPEQGKITLSVFHEDKDSKGYCVIQISDTGIGMPAHVQPHIFESFVTGTNVPNISSSIGVGLYIVKHTIDLHHGMIRLHSKENEGSLFTIYIPEGKEHFTDDDYETEVYESLPDPDATGSPATSADNNERDQSQPSLLIIEDNTEIRNYIAGLFKSRYHVYEATDGEEGIKYTETYSPDIIISDVMMPVKDGFECCRQIRNKQNTAHIPIIMLTAKAEDADIIRATRIGIDDYLTKPFNPEVLKAKVENLLSQRERLKRIYAKSLMLKIHSNEQEQSEQDSFMQHVINTIEANLTNETFNVKVLANALNMSQATLYRKIKEHSQLSVIEVIRSVRISKAASLLLQQKYSVQEIVEMVGYNDYDTFRKNFINQFGVTPSKYNKDSSGNDPIINPFN